MKTLWFLFALVLAGCGTTGQPLPKKNFNPQHYAIYVDQFGNIKTPNTAAAGATEKNLLGQADRDRRYVDDIIQNFLKERETRPGLKITVFVHGGLNTFDMFWHRPNRFAQAMINEGQYPIFVGWNSGPFTNYFDHLFRIRKGERRPVLAALSAPFVLIEDITRSIAHLPEAWYRSAMDPLSASKAVTISQEKDYQARRDGLKGFKVHSYPPFDGTGIGGSYWTIINPLKLVTAPFVDGLGAGSWDSMLRRTDLVLSKALAFEGELTDQSEKDVAMTPATPQLGANQTTTTYADTAVTTLLLEIERLSSNPPAGIAPVHTNLIGHSMGTIVVNNILARHPKLNVDNVVFMGAAARIKDVENGVVPWMTREGNGARFYNLSLDPYLEMGENTYHDVFPRGSLLHWIDNIFGEINSFKDRTAGGWWNIIRTANDVFPWVLRPCVHLTRFPIGKAYGPQTHGEFDDYYFWRKSFWVAAGEQPVFDEKNQLPIVHVNDEGKPSDTAHDSQHPCRQPSGRNRASPASLEGVRQPMQTG